ncbi:unknown [Ruminococcus sp. CAG:382]|nr:unknown [Ruminococcus sp. CAG:382]
MMVTIIKIKQMIYAVAVSGKPVGIFRKRHTVTDVDTAGTTA